MKKPKIKPGLFKKARAFSGFFKFPGFLPTLEKVQEEEEVEVKVKKRGKKQEQRRKERRSSRSK